MMETKQKPMPNLWFKLMALEYGTRAKPSLVDERLKQAGVSHGMHVLDYGCGPGRYTLPAASIVGPKGVVYALDIHPLAIQTVEKAAKRRALDNVRLIRSSCASGLKSESIDIAILFDTLHDVDDADGVLHEIRRVLKSKGRLAYKDHTLNGTLLLQVMLRNGLRLVEGSEVLSFEKC